MTVFKGIKSAEPFVSTSVVAISGKSAAFWPVLIGMLASSTVIALVLAIYFHTGTMRRMQVVLGNLNKLSHGLPLDKQLAGADEIGRIDQAFHSMKEAIEQAARKERGGEFVRPPSEGCNRRRR